MIAFNSVEDLAKALREAEEHHKRFVDLTPEAERAYENSQWSNWYAEYLEKEYEARREEHNACE